MQMRAGQHSSRPCPVLLKAINNSVCDILPFLIPGDKLPTRDQRLHIDPPCGTYYVHISLGSRIMTGHPMKRQDMPSGGVQAAAFCQLCPTTDQWETVRLQRAFFLSACTGGYRRIRCRHQDSGLLWMLPPEYEAKPPSLLFLLLSCFSCSSHAFLQYFDTPAGAPPNQYFATGPIRATYPTLTISIDTCPASV